MTEKEKKVQLTPGSEPIPEKVDWVKVCQERENTFLVPKDFAKRFDEIEKMRKKYNEMAEKMARDELTLTMMTQNIYFDFREYLHQKGVGVWMLEIGLDPIAMKDGVYVVNAYQSKKQ